MRRAPDPVDIHVGNRVKGLRVLRGMSQEKLGQAVGVTFQQIQKYERGANRMGASRLVEIGTALDVPAAYFFAELPSNGKPIDPAARDALHRRESLELVRAYWNIKNDRLRRRIYGLVKTAAGPKR